MALKTISILILFSTFPSLILCASKLKKLPLPSVTGPLAYAFDSKGSGPYAGVGDGRIFKYDGSKTGFVEYGQTSSLRNKTLCDGTNNFELAAICGKASGLGFYYHTGELFIADSIYGLVVISPGERVGKQLATSAGGVPFRLLDSLDVDQSTGDVYFSDTSAVYNLSQTGDLFRSNDTTGRLMKYDPKTKQVIVVFDRLAAATGVALSEDGSYILVIELLKAQVRKIWLKGPKANTSEILVTFTGFPDKIRRTAAGDFWVAVTVYSKGELLGQRISGCGEVLETVDFSTEFNTTWVSEVHEYNNGLYLGSLDLNYVGVYKGFKKFLADDEL